MTFKIEWSPQAEESYLHVLSQIIDKWNMFEAQKLADKVNRLLSALTKNEFLCPRSKIFQEVRRCVVTKQTSLAYKISGATIQILSVYDNRSSLSF